MCSRSDACPAGTAGTNDVIPPSAPAPFRSPGHRAFSLLFAPGHRAFSRLFAPFNVGDRAFSLLLAPPLYMGKIRGLLPPKKSRMPARDSRPPGGALTAYLRCNFWRTRQSLRENWRREFEPVASGEPSATPPKSIPAPNDGAQWQAPRTVAISRMFSGKFAVRMSALREIVR